MEWLIYSAIICPNFMNFGKKRKMILNTTPVTTNESIEKGVSTQQRADLRQGKNIIAWYDSGQRCCEIQPR